MSRAARLAELRELRATGKTRLSTYQVAEEEQVYDEVDEEGYKKVVRGRLDQDDFVIQEHIVLGALLSGKPYARLIRRMTAGEFLMTDQPPAVKRKLQTVLDERNVPRG